MLKIMNIIDERDMWNLKKSILWLHQSCAAATAFENALWPRSLDRSAFPPSLYSSFCLLSTA